MIINIVILFVRQIMANKASKNNSLYHKLFNEYKLFENFDSGVECQESFNDMWAEAKNQFVNDRQQLEQWAEEKIIEYQKKRTIKKSSSILTFLSRPRADVSHSLSSKKRL